MKPRVIAIEGKFLVEGNLNDRIGVKLTDYGRSRYRDYMMEHTGERREPIEIEGWTTFMLWEFARIFGPVLHQGSTQIVCEKNDFRLERTT